MFPTIRNEAAHILRQGRTMAPIAQGSAALNALKAGSWHRSLLQGFRIQRAGGECVANSFEMHETVLAGLARQGLVSIADVPGQFPTMRQQLQQVAGRWNPPSIMATDEDVSVDNIVGLCQRKGITVLNLARLLPPEHGGSEYAGHHAVVPIGVIQVLGERWAVALDGNDLQQHPDMDRVRACADRYFEGDCHEVTPLHEPAIENLVYTLINLDRAVPRSQQAQIEQDRFLEHGGGLTEPVPITQRNAILYATNVELREAPLNQEMADRIATYIESHLSPEAYMKLHVG